MRRQMSPAQKMGQKPFSVTHFSFKTDFIAIDKVYRLLSFKTCFSGPLNFTSIVLNPFYTFSNSETLFPTSKSDSYTLLVISLFSHKHHVSKFLQKHCLILTQHQSFLYPTMYNLDPPPLLLRRLVFRNVKLASLLHTHASSSDPNYTGNTIFPSECLFKSKHTFNNFSIALKFLVILLSCTPDHLASSHHHSDIN